MATVQQLEAALVKAHNAGDTRGAQAIAAEIKRVRAAPQQQQQQQPGILASTAQGFMSGAESVGNFFNHAVATLVDKFNITPSQAVSWAAQHLSGYSPTEANRIAQNLKSLGSFSNVVKAGIQGQQQAQAPYRQAHPNYFTGGRIAGGAFTTSPVGAGLGAATRAIAGGTKAGEALATALESGGFKTDLLPTRAAVKEGLAAAPTLVQRAVDMAIRGTGGGVTGATIGKLTDDNATAGGIIGALMPTIGSSAARPVIDKVVLPFWEQLSGKVGVQRAAAIFRNAFNMSIQEVKQLAQNAPEGMPFAEVLARAGKDEPTVQAINKMVTQGPGRQVYAPLEQAQREAEQAQLNALRRGSTAGEARAGIEAEKTAAGEAYRQQFGDIAANANLGGEVIPGAEAAAQQMRRAATGFTGDVRRFAPASERFAGQAETGAAEPSLANVDFLKTPEQLRMSELASQAAQHATEQANASLGAGATARALEQQVADLRAAGHEVLQSGPLAARIRQLAAGKDVQGVPEIEKSLASLASEIESGGPIITAEKLDNLYKGVGATVASFMRNPNDVGGLKNFSGMVVNMVKPEITNAIETAGGKGYGELKGEYARKMGEQAKRDFAGTLSDIYANAPEDFARIVGGKTKGALETVANAFPMAGKENWNINAMMGQEYMPTLQNVAENIGTRNRMAEQANVGEYAAKQLFQHPPEEAGIFSSNLSPAAWLSKAILTAKTGGLSKIANFAEMMTKSGLSPEGQQALVNGLRSGKGAEELLSTLPLADIAQLNRRLRSNASWNAQARLGGILGNNLVNAATAVPTDNNAGY